MLAAASACTKDKRQNRDWLCGVGPHPGARFQHARALRCGVGESFQILLVARGQMKASRVQCQEATARRRRYRKRGRGGTARFCLRHNKHQVPAPQKALEHHRRPACKHGGLCVIAPSNKYGVTAKRMPKTGGGDYDGNLVKEEAELPVMVEPLPA